MGRGSLNLYPEIRRSLRGCGGKTNALQPTVQEGVMSKEARPERPKIYVNARGGLYVKADELLRSEKARAIIEKMAKMPLKQMSTSSKERVEKPN